MTTLDPVSIREIIEGVVAELRPIVSREEFKIFPTKKQLMDELGMKEKAYKTFRARYINTGLVTLMPDGRYKIKSSLLK